MFDVSIILPALSINSEYLRCIYAIRTALAGHIKFEIICVVPDAHAFSSLESDDLRIVQEDGPGIYGAMNTGLSKAIGSYVYFIGQDDVLLPAAAEAITQGLECQADMILGDVFWGGRKIFKNWGCRNALVWRNWCHQAIFYNRLKFIDSVGEFPVAFKIQADHYANIVFCSISGFKLLKYGGCISWYSSNGFSSRSTDTEFRNAFPNIVRQYFGLFSYWVVVIRRVGLAVFKRALGKK